MKKVPAVLACLGLAATSLAFTSQQALGTEHLGGSSKYIYVLESNGTLSIRDSGLPLLARHRMKVRGVNPGDRLVGLDTRPATRELYALGKSGQLYRLDGRTGRATTVGTAAAGSVGTAVGFDFNPTVDRIRVVTASGRNLRVHPDTGAVAAVDGHLTYVTGAAVPRVAASAYTDNFAGATRTGLYGLDAATDRLVTQGTLPGVAPAVSPNTGQLFTVGRLGIDIGTVSGFDINGRARAADKYDARDYEAIAAVHAGGLLPGSKLVRIDLKTGRAVPLLALGLNEVVGLTFADS